MQAHCLDPDVFIRSVSTRGRRGGLARATRQIARLLDAFGKDTILIALGRQTRMHFRQRFLRIFFEALVQVQIDEFP